MKNINEMHNKVLEEDEEHLNEMGEFKQSVRVINKEGRQVLVRLDIVNQKISNAILAKLNYWEERDTNAIEGERKNITKAKGVVVNPIVCLRSLVSKKKKRLPLRPCALSSLGSLRRPRQSPRPPAAGSARLDPWRWPRCRKRRGS